MIDIRDNITAIISDLRDIPNRIDAAIPPFFRANRGEMLQNGREIVHQVVYVSFPEGKKYIRRGTTTTSLGILNSIVAQPNQQGNGNIIGITTSSSALADTIPKTVVGRAFADSYAAYMITGGGFLEPLGTDIRNFLDVWEKYFEVTLPYKFLKDVVIPAVR